MIFHGSSSPSATGFVFSGFAFFFFFLVLVFPGPPWLPPARSSFVLAASQQQRFCLASLLFFFSGIYQARRGKGREGSTDTGSGYSAPLKLSRLSRSSRCVIICRYCVCTVHTSHPLLHLQTCPHKKKSNNGNGARDDIKDAGNGFNQELPCTRKRKNAQTDRHSRLRCPVFDRPVSCLDVCLRCRRLSETFINTNP